MSGVQKKRKNIGSICRQQQHGDRIDKIQKKGETYNEVYLFGMRIYL